MSEFSSPDGSSPATFYMHARKTDLFPMALDLMVKKGINICEQQPLYRYDGHPNYVSLHVADTNSRQFLNRIGITHEILALLQVSQRDFQPPVDHIGKFVTRARWSDEVKQQVLQLARNHGELLEIREGILPMTRMVELVGEVIDWEMQAIQDSQSEKGALEDSSPAS